MATKVASVGTVHIVFNDATHRIDDKVGDKETGFFIISAISGGAVVVKIYADGYILWNAPPAPANWVAIGAHLQVTIP